MDALKLHYCDKENVGNGKESLRERFEDLLAKTMKTMMMQVTERMSLHVRIELVSDLWKIAYSKRRYSRQAVYKRNC